MKFNTSINSSIKPIFAVCGCLMLIQSGMTQNLVQDTLTVSFSQRKTMLPSNVIIDTVIDDRSEPGRFINVYETVKYLFVPVDLLIQVPRPLNMEIQSMFGTATEDNTLHNLEVIVKDFRISNKSSPYLTSRYQLNATLRFQEKLNGQDSQFIGELVYETVYNEPFFRSDFKKGYIEVMHRWQEAVLKDVCTLAQDLLNERSCKLPNYRSVPYTGKHKNLIGYFDTVFGPDWWMFDVHVIFSDREATSWFYRKGGHHLRYRYTKDFDAIEFGIAIDQWYYRINRKWLFRLKSNLMFGFNRWTNMTTVEHTLYDIVILDYSFSQMLQYNPLDHRAFLLGLGLLQDVTYIYSEGVQFRYGLMIQMGVKL